MDLLTAAVASGTLLLLLILFRRRRNTSHAKSPFPPSPPPIPIIGHLHLLNPPRHLSISALASQYGPVVALRLGTHRRAVIVSSASAIEEALLNNDITFSNHPHIFAGGPLSYDNTTMFFAPYGPRWRDLRKLMLVHLLSSSRLASLAGARRRVVLRILCDMTKRSEGVKLTEVMFEAAYSMMAAMVTGRSSYDAGEFQAVMGKSLKLMFAFNPRDFFGGAVGWVDATGVEKKMKQLSPRLDGFLAGILEERRRRRSSEGKDSTFTDVMLRLQEEDPHRYTDDLIKGQILTLMTAGTSSAVDTIVTAMTFLLTHPHAMNKLISELDANFDSRRIMDESDLPNLPYLNCVIKESLRLFLPNSGLPPRQSSADCTIQGYHVPAGTMLFVNIWGLQRDPLHWDEPLAFQPERFLASGGAGSGGGGFKYLPFGAGRRACPGENLGAKIIGTMVGVLVQCFEWEAMGEDDADLGAVMGLTLPKSAEPLTFNYRVRPCMKEALMQCV